MVELSGFCVWVEREMYMVVIRFMYRKDIWYIFIIINFVDLEVCDFNG